jgi:hypothetical protein
MTLDSSGRLGIGSTSLVATLDVQAATGTFRLASSTGTNAAYMYAQNTGGDFYIGRDNSTASTFGSNSAYSSVLWSAGAYPMAFFTNGTPRMYVNASGRVGVGVLPTTTTKFQVVSDTTSIASFQDNSAQGIKYVVGTSAGQINHFATWEASGVGAYHAWYVTTSAGSQPQAMTLNVNGALALLGASTSATGVGITFPATQSASSNVNTLDDYEEGTWTAVISTESGTNYTITSQTSRYTKIGNVVAVSSNIEYSAVGNGTISKVSLPFSPLQSPISTLIMGTITGPGSVNNLTDLSLIPYTGNEMILRVSAADTNYWSASSNFRSSGTLTFNGSFITST